MQARLAAFYAQLENYFPNERITHVNGDQDVETVCKAVVGHVDALRALG